MNTIATRITRGSVHLVIYALALTMLFPFLWMVSTSLKDMAGIDAIPSYVDSKINMSKVRKMAAAIQSCPFGSARQIASASETE